MGAGALSDAGPSAARDAIVGLLQARNPGATICPSEAARKLAADRGSHDWRTFMEPVHEAVDAMLSERSVQISWKGVAMDRRSGPYRIAGRDRLSRRRDGGKA